MVDQESKLGHNLEESAPRDHTVTDCPKGYIHAHTYTVQPSGGQTFKTFQIQTTTLHREMLPMFSNPITRRSTGADQYKEKTPLIVYTCS